MQKEKNFEKIKKLLHQFKMRKVRFEEITYIKVKNNDDYIAECIGWIIRS